MAIYNHSGFKNWLENQARAHSEFIPWAENYCFKKSFSFEKDLWQFLLSQDYNPEVVLIEKAMKSAWHRKISRKHVKHLNLVLPFELYDEIEKEAELNKESIQVFISDMIELQLPSSRFKAKEKLSAIKRSEKHAAKNIKKYEAEIKKLNEELCNLTKLYEKTQDELEEFKKDNPHSQELSPRKKYFVTPKVGIKKISN